MEKISFLNNIWIIIPLVIWTLSWKGVALWKAARENQMGWFVVLLILNTAGILEIIYIFFVAKKSAVESDEGKISKHPVSKKIV